MVIETKNKKKILKIKNLIVSKSKKLYIYQMLNISIFNIIN